MKNFFLVGIFGVFDCVIDKIFNDDNIVLSGNFRKYLGSIRVGVIMLIFSLGGNFVFGKLFVGVKKY